MNAMWALLRSGAPIDLDSPPRAASVANGASAQPALAAVPSQAPGQPSAAQAVGGTVPNAVALTAGVAGAQPEEDCLVDGVLEHVANKAAGKFYLWSAVTERGPPRYRTPDEIGREGLYRAIQAAYARAYPADHALHAGPAFGKVARELHRLSPVHRSRNPHLHAATAFLVEHKWKALERILREEHKIKVPRWQRRHSHPLHSVAT